MTKAGTSANKQNAYKLLTNLAGKEVFIQIKPGIEYMYTMPQLLELFGDWSEPFITNKLLPEL